MVFNIRQHTTLPVLKMKVFRDGRNDYNRLFDLLENSAVTFAMKEQTTGIYKVTNKEASLSIKKPCSENTEKEYFLSYQFTKTDTDKIGIFIGEFKITLFDENQEVTGELIVPIGEQLYIHVLNSFVKADII